MSAAVGAFSGLLFLAAAPLVSASIGDALVAMGVLLPVLYVQDALRYWYIQQTKPSGAAVLDAVWLAVFAAAAAVLMTVHAADRISLTLAWGVGAAVAAGYGCVAVRTGVHPAAVVRHLRKHARTSLGLLADAVLVAGTAQLLPVLVAIAGGLVAAGAFRAAQTLMGAVTMVVAGLTPVALSSAVRGGRRAPRAFVGRWSLVILGLSAVNGLALLLLPDSWGRQVSRRTGRGRRHSCCPSSSRACCVDPSPAP